MADNETFDELGYEPIPDVVEDDSQAVFNILEDAGIGEYVAEIDTVDEAFDTITRVKQSGEVDQETVEALESYGIPILNDKYIKAMFTTAPSTLYADHVIASLEGSAKEMTAKLFVKAGQGFVKAVKSSFETASEVVTKVLDNTSGVKPAIDFSVKRLNALHDALKDAVEERGGWPSMGHDMLEDPTKPLDIYFLRENIDKGLGAFVKRRAAAALIRRLNGSRPLVEGEIITRPEAIQKAIGRASEALHKAVKNLNRDTDLKVLTTRPDQIRPVGDDVLNAITDLKGRLETGEPFETTEPTDYQNFTRVAETIDGAIKAIASSKLVGSGFKELASRVNAMDRTIAQTKEDEGLSEESLHAWETLAKNLKAVSELYACLAQYAQHVENVADLFYRVLINARRDMVVAVEVAAEQTQPLVSKRLILLADREKDRLIEDQDAMRKARKKAEAQRSTDE